MSEEAPAALDFGKLHVLVVDDDKFARDLAWNVLRELGFGKISTAVDGVTALEVTTMDRWPVDSCSIWKCLSWTD